MNPIAKPKTFKEFNKSYFDKKMIGEIWRAASLINQNNRTYLTGIDYIDSLWIGQKQHLQDTAGNDEHARQDDHLTNNYFNYIGGIDPANIIDFGE